MAEAYIRLDETDDDIHSALDPYGAEAPAELFAVAVEAYFETPIPLKKQYPRLYAELLAFFNVEV
jgi:Mlc titration factor MtfA (ptsG expression regulator)